MSKQAQQSIVRYQIANLNKKKAAKKTKNFEDDVRLLFDFFKHLSTLSGVGLVLGFTVINQIISPSFWSLMAPFIAIMGFLLTIGFSVFNLLALVGGKRLTCPDKSSPIACLRRMRRRLMKLAGKLQKWNQFTESE